MEGVPRIPMLSFSIRRSADTPSFKGKLQKFIAVQYGESPNSYSKEINELESLRAGAIHATADYSGCATLKKYYCQLHFLKSRFPLNEGSPVAINFSWYDIFSDQIHSWSDIDFEVSCILFNVGALHSKVAGADSRTTVDDMKNCVTHYQCAAWAFEHLRSNYAKFFTPDVSSDLLGLMSNICLAQAQECVVEKSLVDNRRSVITAKLLLQIVDYYQLGLKTVDLLLKDASHHSDRMVKAVRKWKKMIELKIAYYSSLTYLYRGQQAEDQKQYGERVTFYKAAQEKIELALKMSKTFEKSDGVHETLNFVLDVVVGKATAAQKDNEFIYHQKVPAIDAIGETIKGVAIVKPIPLKVDDPSGDIFARLVPMEAHEASSLYSEEKAKLLRSYAEKIEDKNIALQKFLLAIQLESLQIHDSENKLPEELVDCCAAMNGKPDAVKKLVELMGTLSTMFMDVDEKLEDIKKIFETQAEKEAEHGRVFGKQPPSNVFVELRHEFEKFDKAHSLAKGSNETLREAIGAHVKNLRILMKPLPELIKLIPSPQPIGESDKEAVDEMKRLAGKVEEMRKQRISLEKDLRESVQQDDITQRVVVTADDDVEALFRQEIAKHSKITQIIDQNLLAQENIMRALTEANARYAGTREVTMRELAERNAFVQNLLTSYEAYDELVEKCTGGIDFYKKLEEGVGKLHGRVKGIARVQDEEREAKLSAMQTVYARQVAGPPTTPSIPPLSSIPSPAATVGGHPKLKDYLASRRIASGAPASAPVSTYAPSAPFHGSVLPHYGSQAASTTPNIGSQAVSSTPNYGLQPASSTPNYGPQASTTSNYGSQAASGTPYYGSQAASTTPNNGSQAVSATPNYGSQPSSTITPNYGSQASATSNYVSQPASTITPNYGSQASATTSNYGSQAASTIPYYGSQAVSATPYYGTQGASTAPNNGSQAMSSTPNYGSQAVSSTPNYGSQAVSSTPNYGSQAVPSTPNYGSQPASNTPNYGSQASATSNYGAQAASTTPNNGLQAVSSTVNYGSQNVSSTSDYGSKAASTAPNYGSQAASTTPNYGSQPAPTTNYGSQAPTTSNYGSQAASVTPNYVSQVASATPNNGPLAVSSTPSYGTQNVSSTPDFGSQAASTTPNYGSQASTSSNYDSQSQTASFIPNYYGSQGSSTPAHGSQSASFIPNYYGAQATASNDSEPTSFIPNYYRSQPASTTPNYGSQVSTTSNYDTQSVSFIPNYYGSQSSSSAPAHGSQSASFIPNEPASFIPNYYRSQAASFTPNYASQVSSSTPNYTSQGPSSTPNYDAHQASTTPNLLG